MPGECIPFYENGSTITAQAAAAVVAKTFVKISASRPYGPGFSLSSTDSGGGNLVVEPASAGGIKFGVAATDQPTVGGKVAILTGVGFVLPVTAALAIQAFQEVSIAAGGQVRPRTDEAGALAEGGLGTVGTNNAILFKARGKGVAGNAVKIVIEPLGKSTVFGIVQNGTEFKVTLKTSAGNVSETKASEVITKLEENAEFKAMVKAENKEASTGAGLAEPGTAQLAGGLDEGESIAVGLCLSACNANEDAQIKQY